MRELGHHAAGDGTGGVGGFVDREQNFEIGIVLREEAAQIGLGIVGRAGQRAKHCDGREFGEFGRTAALVSPRANDGQGAVNQ